MNYLLHLRNRRNQLHEEYLELKDKYTSEGLTDEEENKINYIIQAIYYMDCCLAEYKGIIGGEE